MSVPFIVRFHLFDGTSRRAKLVSSQLFYNWNNLRLHMGRRYIYEADCNLSTSNLLQKRSKIFKIKRIRQLKRSCSTFHATCYQKTFILYFWAVLLHLNLAFDVDRLFTVCSLSQSVSQSVSQCASQPVSQPVN